MKKLMLAFSVVLFIISFSYGQVKAVTETGDSVLLFDDNTWKPIIIAPKAKATVPFVIPSIGSVKVTVSQDNGERTMSTINWSDFGIDKEKMTLSASMRKVGHNYMVSIVFGGGVGCLNKDQSSLKIILNDGKIVDCVQISKTDCSESPSAQYILLSAEQVGQPSANDIMQENVQKLVDTDWTSIRIYGSTFFSDLKPKKTKENPKPAQFFRQHISALVN